MNGLVTRRRRRSGGSAFSGSSSDSRRALLVCRYGPVAAFEGAIGRQSDDIPRQHVYEPQSTPAGVPYRAFAVVDLRAGHLLHAQPVLLTSDPRSSPLCRKGLTSRTCPPFLFTLDGLKVGADTVDR